MQSAINKYKFQLASAVIAVIITAIALTSTTYAWYVSNSKVHGTTSTISAMTNNFVLQIATLEDGTQRGDNAQSLSATTLGGRISPASTADSKNWYVCGSWGQDGKVHDYYSPSDLTNKGKYVAADGDHYAYLKGEYILYTVTDTGICDVYLGPDEMGKYITVTQTSGENLSETVPGSIRVGITTQPMLADGSAPDADEPETLVIVYAPEDETGKGNDADALYGWSCVKDENHLMNVPYVYLYGEETTASDGQVYVATKNADIYAAPDENGCPIAMNVGYNGVVMRVYIWLEGTDAQCVNTTGEEDTSTYDVSLNLAGVAK